MNNLQNYLNLGNCFIRFIYKEYECFEIIQNSKFTHSTLIRGQL